MRQLDGKLVVFSWCDQERRSESAFSFDHSLAAALAHPSSPSINHSINPETHRFDSSPIQHYTTYPTTSSSTSWRISRCRRRSRPSSRISHTPSRSRRSTRSWPTTVRALALSLARFVAASLLTRTVRELCAVTGRRFAVEYGVELRQKAPDEESKLVRELPRRS